MISIESIIQQEANPFDPVTFKTGNFWREDDGMTDAVVETIHKNEIHQITSILNQVAKDHRTRTILLVGDRGAGKSYALKRLKQSLNSQAFFVYVPPFIESDYIWRHTLRQTVDSLMNVPQGAEESQLLLWLKSLSVFRDRSLMKKLFGERGLFIKNLRSSYPTSIYQAKEFFGVLYDLTNPDLYFAACNWLRGDDLDEEDLKSLGVKQSINSETAAQGILANLGRISTSTHPIVLCFDQVETKLLPDGSADIQPVFNVSTTFHNESLKNFLIIISITIDNWMQNKHRIQQTDKDRVEKYVALKQINLDQAEALWKSRLSFLHLQADPQPVSPIYPLQREALEIQFPGGKTTPRNALKLGYFKFMEHKTGGQPVADDLLASFKLLWQKEFSLTQQKVTRIRQFSAEELIAMTQRAMVALQVKGLQPRVLPSQSYASYSFSYQAPNHTQQIGLVWLEEPNMTSFYRVMQACEKLLRLNRCDSLCLIRAETVGRKTNKGYVLYNQIFAAGKHHHIKPDLASVHYLATYNRLVNSTRAGELVIASKTLQVSDLESLIRESEVLDSCGLLQDLKIVSGEKVVDRPFKEAKEFILNFVKRELFIAWKTVHRNAISQFGRLSDEQILNLLQELCQENQIRILDESVPVADQIVCLVPTSGDS